MESNIKDKESAVVHDNEFINKKIQAVPKPKINRTGMTDIGLATKVVNDAKTDDNRVNAQISTLDLSALNSFTNISAQRDKLYTILENMADDPTIAAALEMYAEDSTQPNDTGKIVWAESDDSEVSKYINFLIESLQINKNIYKWAYSLCEYGDVYVETFRESEKDDDTITFEKKQKALNEAINVNLYSINDPLVHYVEMYPNPAELFELTKFGKTAGYIKTDITTMTKNFNNILNTSYQYKFKQGDINVYNANKFVHACLDDNSSRVPEKVELFKDEDSLNNNKGNEYTVKRGKALFYNVYKIWRIMSLLEDSMLLNRLTKSSILRLIEVEVGDMPKEDVISYLNNLKSTMEQKTALNVGNAMSEYNNPGPVINNVYIPTRGEQGKITTSEVGGDLQVSQLPDVEFLNNKFYGAIRIPKPFLGFSDDSTGFNGGTSLTILSSRYAKTIKRIQAVLSQLVTDIITIFLLDKQQESYLGKFTIKMQAPVTQEDIDRKDNDVNKIATIRDTLDLLDIQTPSKKLEIAKDLLASIINNPEVLDLLEEEIENLKKQDTPIEKVESSETPSEIDSHPLGLDRELGLNRRPDFEATSIESEVEEPAEETETSLPTPEELGIGDLTDNTSEE